MIWKNFTLEEFKCKHCGLNKMDHLFIDKLQELRTIVGFPLYVNSGYRCPEYNAQISTTGDDGPHTTGRAVDLGVSHKNALIVLRAAIASGKFTGFGIKQHGTGRFLHLDDLAESVRPTIWSYP